MSEAGASTFRIEQVESVRLHDLRRRVLRGGDSDASVDDLLDDDETSLHVAGLLGERIVVSSSFFVVAGPVHVDVPSRQLRFMATDPVAQGRGYGSSVLAWAEDRLRDAGTGVLWAFARDTALGFYQAQGWSVIEGSQHLSSATNLPHTTIYKLL